MKTSVLPKLNENGELPPGEHECEVHEIDSAFGSSNERRAHLMKGLKNALGNLGAAGVKRVFVDGSFTSDKAEPNDIDGCWDYEESVDIDLLDPVFLDESRSDMKKKYGVDFFLYLRSSRATLVYRSHSFFRKIEMVSPKEF